MSAKVTRIQPTTPDERKRVAKETQRRALDYIAKIAGTTGDELAAEGWIAYEPGKVWLFWTHEPTRQSVGCDDWRRDHCDWPCWGPEPETKDAMGFAISVMTHDELGNPIGGSGAWVADAALAIRLARKNRLEILRRPP